MDSNSRSASPREASRPQHRPPSPPSPAAFDNRGYQHDDLNHNDSFVSNGTQQNGHSKESNGDTKTLEAVNLELINLQPKNGNSKKKDVELDMNSTNPYDEYFVPVNEHRKYMRGEKLYVTADKRGEKGGCKRPLCWTILGLVVAAVITLIALAATGILFTNSPTPVEQYNASVSSARALGGIGHEHDHSSHDHDHHHHHDHDTTLTADHVPGDNEQPKPSTNNQHGPDTQSDEQHRQTLGSDETGNISKYVPRTVEGELKIDNEEFTMMLANSESEEYKRFTESFTNALKQALFAEASENGNDVTVEVINLRKGSIIVTYRIHWKPMSNTESDNVMTANQLKTNLSDYLSRNNRMLNIHHVAEDDVSTRQVLDLCQRNNNDCEHGCEFNASTLQFACICPPGLMLDIGKCKPILDPNLIEDTRQKGYRVLDIDSTKSTDKPTTSEYNTFDWKETHSVMPEITTETDPDLKFSHIFGHPHKQQSEIAGDNDHTIQSVPEPTSEPHRQAGPTAEPESTAEPKPEAEPTAEPEPVTESKPEPSAEPEPIAESNTEPTAEPEPIAEPKPEAEPTAEPEPIAEPKPEAEPTAEPEPIAEPKPEAEPEPIAEPKPEAEPTAEPEPIAEPKPVAEPTAEPEPIAEPKPEAEPTAEPEPIAEPKPEAEPTAEQEAIVKPTSELEKTAEPKLEVLPVLEPEPTAEPKPEIEPTVELEPNAEPEPTVEPKSEAEPEATAEPNPDQKSKSEPELNPKSKKQPTESESISEPTLELAQSAETSPTEVKYDSETTTVASPESTTEKHIFNPNSLPDVEPTPESESETAHVMADQINDSKFIDISATEHYNSTNSNLSEHEFIPTSSINDTTSEIQENKDKDSISSKIFTALGNQSSKMISETSREDEPEVILSESKPESNKSDDWLEDNKQDNTQESTTVTLASSSVEDDILLHSIANNTSIIDQYDATTTIVPVPENDHFSPGKKDSSYHESSMFNNIIEKTKNIDKHDTELVDVTTNTTSAEINPEHVQIHIMEVVSPNKEIESENSTTEKPLDENADVSFDSINMLMNRSSKSIGKEDNIKDEISTTDVSDSFVTTTTDSDWLSESVTEINYKEAMNKMETQDSIKSTMENKVNLAEMQGNPKFDNLTTSNNQMAEQNEFMTSTENIKSTTISQFIYNSADQTILTQNTNIHSVNKSEPAPVWENPDSEKDMTANSSENNVTELMREMHSTLQTLNITSTTHESHNDSISEITMQSTTPVNNLNVTIYEISSQSHNHTSPILKSVNAHSAEYEDHETEMNPFLPEIENNKSLVKKLQEGHDLEPTNLNETQNENFEDHLMNNDSRISKINTMLTSLVPNNETITTTTEKDTIFDDLMNLQSNDQSPENNRTGLVNTSLDYTTEKGADKEIPPISTFLIDTDDLDKEHTTEQRSSMLENNLESDTTSPTTSVPEQSTLSIRTSLNDNEFLSVVPIAKDKTDEKETVKKSYKSENILELNDISDSPKKSARRTLHSIKLDTDILNNDA